MHDRISIDTLCFPGAPFTDVARYWRELGARRVSMISPLVLSEDLATLGNEIKARDYILETIAHPFMPGRNLDTREETWTEPRETLSQLIKSAAQLGARSIYLLTGGHGSLTWEQAAECFCTAIAPCVTRANAAGIKLMIESASAFHADLHIAHTLRDTVILAEMAGIGVCIDIYPIWTESGLRASIERAIPRCDLIQVSDYVYGDRSLPARAVPGDGKIPLQRITEWILGSGYTGAFDLELIGPRIDKEGHLEATRRAAQCYGDMLRSLGA